MFPGMPSQVPMQAQAPLHAQHIPASTAQMYPPSSLHPGVLQHRDEQLLGSVAMDTQSQASNLMCPDDVVINHENYTPAELDQLLAPFESDKP